MLMLMLPPRERCRMMREKILSGNSGGNLDLEGERAGARVSRFGRWWFLRMIMVTVLSFWYFRISLKRQSHDSLQHHLTLEVLEKSGRGGGREVLSGGRRKGRREGRVGGGECLRRRWACSSERCPVSNISSLPLSAISLLKLHIKWFQASLDSETVLSVVGLLQVPSYHYL